MPEITDIQAREILDSRGTPTVEVDVILENTVMGRASVPSGASTGSHEAIEKRDNQKKRYFGQGVLNNIHDIQTLIKPHLIGQEAVQQAQLDNLLCSLDGTKNKSKLGANTILAVSLAIAKSAAAFHRLPLYRYLGGVNASTLPVPMMNIINGGRHADNRLHIQEFMIIPIGADSVTQSIQMGDEVFQTLKSLLKQKNLNTAVGDEGGFAPDLETTQQAIELILEAITTAGYKPKKDIALALDCAASEFYFNHLYHLIEGRKLDGEDMIAYYVDLIRQYPIMSLEDPLAEDDWKGWHLITAQLGNRVQLVGDDLFVTSTERLSKGIAEGVANAVLIKPNQIGTLTETMDAIKLAQKNGYKTIVSHRSGETEDTSVADLAVATNCGQIKVGSLSRTDRVCKYNQLMRIEGELGSAGYFGN